MPIHPLSRTKYLVIAMEPEGRKKQSRNDAVVYLVSAFLNQHTRKFLDCHDTFRVSK
jgi:hypothetical protein